MKALLITALALCSFAASAADSSKVLLSRSSYSMFDLENGGTYRELRDDGFVYEKIGRRMEKIGEVKSVEQLQMIKEAIARISDNARLAKSSDDCGLDGGATYSVHGDQFEGGSKVIMSSECEDLFITSKTVTAKGLVKIIDSPKSRRN